MLQQRRSWRRYLIYAFVGAASLGAFSLAAQNPPAPLAGQASAPGAPGGVGGGARGFGGDPAAADFSPKPAYAPRPAAEQARMFILPAGYRMELVASDPDVINPAVIEFDGNGRMYVGEMISYMMDAEATREHDPISRISRWESTRGDGRFDKHTIFVDHLVAPRMILTLQDGVIWTSETDSDEIVQWSDTNGDGVADRREVVYRGIGQSGDANIEHQKAGLMWNLDNWIYTDYNAFRIRWTPRGLLRESTGSNGGQWGLAHDDDGKPWFVDAGGERGPMNFQFPIHYGGFTPCAPAGAGRGRGFGAAPEPAPAVDPDCPTAFEKDFEVVWPAPGIGDMQGGLRRTRMPAQNLNHFTAATGPEIVRGHRLPADLQGDLLFTEPVGRLIRRAKIVNMEGLTQLRNAYPGAEFITSHDQLFRPVNIRTAPDGTIFIADMYHGIIQERQWSGPGTYLRAKIEQYQLDKVAAHGRIWRLRYDGRAAVPGTPTNPGQTAIPAVEPDVAAPKMYSETPAQLVAHLSHANGWWRDMSQRILILTQDRSIVPALQQLAAGGQSLVGRFHALWTLEGLGALDASFVREQMKDPSPRMRIQAIRASETLFKAGNRSFDADYRVLAKDADPNVAIQAILTLDLFNVADLPALVKSVQASNTARGVKEIGDRVLAASAAAASGRGRGAAGLSPEQQTLLEQGGRIFNELCSSCHGDDARGRPMAGAAPGATMAPPLTGSPRVSGHRDYVIRTLIGGLTGPVDDRTYSEVMIPMGANSDEWIASAASYIRTNFGNNGGTVAPADVARVRAATGRRTTPFTVAEIETTLPRLLEPQATWKVTASHNTDQAPNALTLRGWSTGTPQTAGMWFQIELPLAATVTEIQFGSPAGRGAGAGPGGFGRGAPGVPPAPPAPPVFGFPRAYRVEASMDGRTWSQPVATGRGSGARTTITFAPTQARLIKVTQTETADGAPPWSMNGLQLFATGRP